MPDAQSLTQLSRTLGGLAEQGADFTRQHPEDAAQGRWWRRIPLNLRPGAEVPMEQSRHAAVLVLFWPEADGPRVLLTERSAALAKHPGQVAFPGGAVEDFDADVAAAALREAQEEVALDPARVQVVGSLPQALVPVSGFIVTPVLACTEDPGALTPHSGEVARVLAVRSAALADPSNRWTAVARRGGHRLPSPAFLLEGSDTGAGSSDPVLVWGFTGILLDRVLDRLGLEQPRDASRQLDPLLYHRA